MVDGVEGFVFCPTVLAGEFLFDDLVLFLEGGGEITNLPVNIGSSFGAVIEIIFTI